MHRIAVVALPGVFPYELGVPARFFRAAQRDMLALRDGMAVRGMRPPGCEEPFPTSSCAHCRSHEPTLPRQDVPELC